jgi:hypothetical protein
MTDWARFHIVGMGLSYIRLLTAFYYRQWKELAALQRPSVNHLLAAAISRRGCRPFSTLFDGLQWRDKYHARNRCSYSTDGPWGFRGLSLHLRRSAMGLGRAKNTAALKIGRTNLSSDQN